MWEIIDDDGVVYSGSEEEMKEVWDKIEKDIILLTWQGDLKLIEIHDLKK